MMYVSQNIMLYTLNLALCVNSILTNPEEKNENNLFVKKSHS